MTRFNYVARGAGGEPISGTLTAGSAAAASQQLRAEGKFLVRLEPSSGQERSARPSSPSAAQAPAAKPAEPADAPAARGRAISRKEIIYMTTQLAVMTETGVPLADALNSISDQMPNARFKTVLNDICERVKSGEEFSASLARHPKVFSSMYVAMVKSAEASGTLGVMLDRVASYLVDEYETRRKVKGALTYPVVMLLFAITVTVFLMVGVLPRFTAIYAGREAALPLPTKIVMAISHFLVAYWIPLVIGVIGAIVGAILFFRTDGGKEWWAAARMKIPLLGSMFHKLQLTRCLRTLGTLIGTGVSMLEAVELTRLVAERGPFVRLWDGVDKSLRDGMQLSEPLFRDKLVPRSIVQMIDAGEKTGQLPRVMNRVADFCDEELKGQIKTSTAMIEPIMIVVMGLIIGTITMALLLPIFNISKVMTSGPGG